MKPDQSPKELLHTFAQLKKTGLVTTLNKTPINGNQQVTESGFALRALHLSTKMKASISLSQLLMDGSKNMRRPFFWSYHRAIRNWFDWLV
ncbi:hypothetical protein [uncultured Roseovarius sp.]|uniref:hypothetical protein n=1 Tax=uncultured Roseovarius sp. TaxID=293344 RepID=UPI0026287F07|nr:hypothetical protein [uncultured Roseovarius sp.]